MLLSLDIALAQVTDSFTVVRFVSVDNLDRKQLFDRLSNPVCFLWVELYLTNLMTKGTRLVIHFSAVANPSLVAVFLNINQD